MTFWLGLFLICAGGLGALGLSRFFTHHERQFYEGVMYCTHCGHPTAYVERGGHAVPLESKGFEVEA